MKKLPVLGHALALFVLLLTACGPVTPAAIQASAPPADPQQYLSDALDIIQKNALNSKNVDWVKLRAMAVTFEKFAKTPADTYDTINYALRQLGDHHSFFLAPEYANQLNTSTASDFPAPEGKVLEEKIGYVAVFEFGAQAKAETTEYADHIQNIIIELDQYSICGWIVDLSQNQGGNMYPMIAGLGALIGEGKLGSFKTASGQISHWYYRDGHAGIGHVPFARVSQPKLLFDPAETPVAVLIGPQTASSGEATAISFRGRPNTRFFGRPSAGLTTGNELYPLKDGAILVLTTVVELDRTGREYGGSITPDVVTADPQSEATEWLLTQPACKK